VFVFEMNEENTKERLLNQLCNLVSGYLEDNVTRPSLETIEKDFFAQDRLADLLLVVNLLAELAQKEGIVFDKDFLRGLSKEEIEKRIDVLNNFIVKQDSKDAAEVVRTEEALNYLDEDSSRRYLLPYLKREINWIIISILSASYVSSLILMRSVFELILGIASKCTGSMTMSDRINSIPFLNDEEKKSVKKLWRRLCAWGHPYGKWVKEICPIYADHKPLYHPGLCELCLQELEEIVDLFAVVAVAKYEIETTKVVAKVRELSIDLKGFELLEARISA